MAPMPALEPQFAHDVSDLAEVIGRIEIKIVRLIPIIRIPDYC